MIRFAPRPAEQDPWYARWRAHSTLKVPRSPMAPDFSDILLYATRDVCRDAFARLVWWGRLQ